MAGSVGSLSARHRKVRLQQSLSATQVGQPLGCDASPAVRQQHQRGLHVSDEIDHIHFRHEFPELQYVCNHPHIAQTVEARRSLRQAHLVAADAKAELWSVRWRHVALSADRLQPAVICDGCFAADYCQVLQRRRQVREEHDIVQQQGTGSRFRFRLAVSRLQA